MRDMPATSMRPSAPKAHAADTGFTTIELMVVAAILAILTALALPSFSSTIARYRTHKTLEELSASIYLARTEGMKRGGHVTLRKAISADCSPPKRGDWSCGWTTFVDANENGVQNDGDITLQETPPQRGVQVLLSNGTDYMEVDRWGQFSGLGAFGFSLAPPGADIKAWGMALCMSSGSRLRAQKGAQSCDLPG
jgi:type IV fimbrial biogenesis protein FimT